MLNLTLNVMVSQCKDIKIRFTWDLNLEDLVKSFEATLWAACKQSKNILLRQVKRELQQYRRDEIKVHNYLHLSWWHNRPKFSSISQLEKKYGNESHTSHAVVLRWLCYYVFMWKYTSGDGYCTWVFLHWQSNTPGYRACSFLIFIFSCLFFS